MAAKLTRTTHQHWVPQFYLSQFATEETQNTDAPQLWFVDVTTPAEEGKVTNVRNMCGQRYLYSPKGINGERDWSVEELLGKVETLAASVWPNLIEGFPSLSDPTLRQALSYFLATMHLRSAWLHNLIDNSFELRDKLYGSPTAESLAGREIGLPDPTDSGRFFVQSLLRDTERFATVFAEKHWAIMCADEDLLLTSDRPLIHQPNDQKRDVFIFPLSPRRVLFMTNEGDAAASLYMPLAKATATTVNLTLGVYCMRFIFGRRPIPDVLGDANFSQTVASLRQQLEAKRMRARIDVQRFRQQRE